MSTEILPDEPLVARLPLPLAQLYRRAHNAKNALERHLTAFYLWEASLKLLGALCVVKYADLKQQDTDLAECLHNLARPSLGHWWEFIRRLLPVLAEQGSGPVQELRDNLLGRGRDDLPRTAGLDAVLREVLEHKTGARATVYPAELLERVVRYRNKELGHGAAGQRAADFYDRVGVSLLLAAGETLGRFDILAGHTLWYLPDIRQVRGQWLIERFDLTGEVARRLESWTLPREAAAALPEPGKVYLARPGATTVDALVRLHPLVVYDIESNECAFLNARRGSAGAEYLCYTTGQTTVRPDLGSEQRKLLARALGMSEITEEQARAWAEKSAAEEGPQPAEVVGPRRLEVYELFSELGRGGMGIVYRAWQPSLGRQVALKCLSQSGDPKAEARFRREIRALGRVDHPHVVKVFASGSEGEHWFYVMELVEGVPLSAVCDKLATSVGNITEIDAPRFQAALCAACTEARQQEKPLSDHGPPATPPATLGGMKPAKNLHGRRDYVARVVNLMRQTAEAAHALHERGIVHRDIKPGNIMISPDGSHATLMDLGLAQLADDVEGRLTRTRQFVGTLRYASPQQVLSVAHMDRRTDVYSLGATLWELLALKPLFGATDQTPTPELMDRVQSQEPERLRRLHPGLSRNLEAVVHKCLEKSIERRYATAHDLAEDLRRVQEGEPVRARPVARVDRTIKWIRRHPAQATAFALMLCTMAALAAGFVLVSLERNRTARARGDLEEVNVHLKLRNDDLRQEKNRTRQALDAMTSEVVGDLLGRQPVLTAKQKKFLEETVAYYQRFAQESGTDRQSRGDVANAYLRMGQLRMALSLPAQAEAAYRSSQKCYARLAADFPANPGYRDGLAAAHTNLGVVLGGAAAIREYHAAVDIYRPLVAAFPSNAHYSISLANAYNNISNSIRPTNKKQAEEAARAGLAVLQPLLAKSPKDPDVRQAVAMSHYELGAVLQIMGSADAVPECRAAVSMYESLATDFPESPDFREKAALSHMNLGALLNGRGKLADAALECEKAAAIHRRLASDFPAVIRYRATLARIERTAGLLSSLQEQWQQAASQLSACVALYKRLNVESRGGYRAELAQSLFYLANALLHLERYAEAAGAADELTTLGVGPKDGDYVAACILALCAPLARKDAKLSATQRNLVAQSYADRALAALRKAVAAGDHDLKAIQEDHDLDSLRDGAEFKQLVASLKRSQPQTKPSGAAK